MILVIDNYDSFIYNIVQYIGEIYPDVKVFRNDKITVEDALALNPDGIVISPGPGRPSDAGISEELIRRAGDVPVFGVCLGHQSITEVFGGEVVAAQRMVHGKASSMTHNGQGIFAGLPNPMKGIRYHSLAANRANFPDTLEITCESDDGEIMGLKVKDKQIYGIQFHPESFLTEEGKKIVKNFVGMVMERRSLRIAGRVKTLIASAAEGQDLTEDEASEMMDAIMSGDATHAQTASYLTALKMKGETAAEVTGSARAMFAKAQRVETSAAPVIDTCGTGGDHSGTFNISTASAFVAAGAGVYVAKHGNRSMTSKSGSADVLEKLGVSIHLNREDAKTCLEANRFAFLFAQNYHPAMKYVAPVRKELGFRTLFNILGPIVNPAGVKRHVMGVFSPELAGLIAQVFSNLGHEHSFVIHSESGLDEASIESPTHVMEVRNGEVTEWTLNAADYALSGSESNLKVPGADASAAIIRGILSGTEKGDPRKAVVLNAALAIAAAKDLSLADAVAAAHDSIDSGAAMKALEAVTAFSGAVQ